MSISLTDELQSFDQRAVIKVCGVGGAGGNAVTRMIEEGLEDVEFIAVNTDAQALKKSPAPCRLQLGAEVTGGLGSGAKPEVGRQAAMEDRERIQDVIVGADMVFVTCGLGGGTGTGAAPIVAEIARESGALTVAIATLPFSFEGAERMENALKGLVELEEHADTMIVVPNARIEKLCQQNVSLLNAFRQADEVLHNGVRAISELITVPGLINVDFADVRTIMQARGRALMGIGIAEGENRAVRAAQEAIVCPLLEQSNIHGAKGVIANVRAGSEVGMLEVQEAIATIKEAAHPEANIIFGAVVDKEERAEIQVTVIAAGFQEAVGEDFLSSAESPAVPKVADTIPFEPKPRAYADANAAGIDSYSTPQNSPSAVPSETGSQVEYLFPQEELEESPPLQRVEPDEDFSIPAFMRRRKRRV